jgi:Fic family protein
VTALEYGLERIETLPIGTRLLIELHERLMQSVRGGAAAGELRRLQVHIGPTTRLSDATYVPPPANYINGLLGDLDEFMHSETDLPALVRLAMVHYQFEAIHPFHDGNGRIGRLLISLLLSAEGLMPQPLLYLSAYFERNRPEYYKRLLEVSTRGAWEAWIVYFLRGIQEQCADAITTANRLQALRASFHERVQTPRRTGLLNKLIDELFIFPALTIREAAKLLEVTARSAQQNVERLVALGILREVTGRKRNRIFISDEIVRTIEGEER